MKPREQINFSKVPPPPQRRKKPHAKQGRNAPVRRGAAGLKAQVGGSAGGHAAAWDMAAVARNGSPIGAGAHGGHAAWNMAAHGNKKGHLVRRPSGARVAAATK